MSTRRIIVRDTSPSLTESRLVIRQDRAAIAGPVGPTGATGIVAQASPPADTSVLWLDTSADVSNMTVPAGGAAGTALTKATATNYDTTWTQLKMLPNRARPIGAYVGLIAYQAASSTAPLDGLLAHPVFMPAGTVIDRLVIEAATGHASATVRLGIYADANGYPGALLLDAGSIPVTSAGIKTLTVNYTTVDDVVWLAAVNNGSAVTFRTGQGTPWPGAQECVSSMLWHTPQRTGVTGALPDPFGGSIAATDPIMIAARRSA